MALKFGVIFGVFFLLFSIALSESGKDEVDVNEVNYLYSTRSLLVYKEGESAKYALFNDSSLVHESLDYHYEKGLAFFQPNMATIASFSSVSLRSNGSTPVTVLRVDSSRNELVSMFAVDWVHDRVIWSTFGADSDAASASASAFGVGVRNTVASAGLSGSDRKILRVTNATLPSGLAIDPFVGKIFWIHDLFKIVSCNLDGGDFKTVIEVNRNVDVVTRLSLDLAAQRVVYLETENSAHSGRYLVKSADYAGGRPRHLYTLDKTTENLRRDVRSLDFLRGRLFVFSGLYDRATDRVESFVLHSLVNGTVEGKRMFADEGVLEDGSDPAVATLHARLVHAELQPLSDPKRIE